MRNAYYLAYGGGGGDVWWDHLHDPASALVAPLVRDRGARVMVVTQCHNSGVVDWFAHHPYIRQHIAEEWEAPSPENQRRFLGEIDGCLPLQNQAIYTVAGLTVAEERPTVHLLPAEQAIYDSIFGDGCPVVVACPWAGLSDRDAFDPPTLRRLVETLSEHRRDVRVVVLGHNHARNHKYTQEGCGFEHPNLVDLVDRCGLRLGWHLATRCTAYVGAHSNLIRAAWDAGRRTATVIPTPSMTDHWPSLDPKYRYADGRDNCRTFTFPFGPEKGVARDFAALDVPALAGFLLEDLS